jgi:hypothetical protein
MNQTTSSRIQKNKRRIFDAESFVRFDTAQVLVARSAIEENRTLALESFTAEAIGNGTLLSSTYDDVIRNRLQIVDLLEPANQDQVNFKNAITNAVLTEGIEGRSVMNAHLIGINKRLTQVNKLLVEINILITEHNNEFFEVIDELTNTNAAWVDGELNKMMESADSSSNEQRIVESISRVTEIREKADTNRANIMALYDAETESRHALEKDLEDVMELRSQIVSLREKVVANQHRVADKIATL